MRNGHIQDTTVLTSRSGGFLVESDDMATPAPLSKNATFLLVKSIIVNFIGSVIRGGGGRGRDTSSKLVRGRCGF